ncbi:MAG: hypothetical protein U9R08_03815 [Nanoarchaeota archaeon]|nr:hypothetical protein [Nanoarchaeota archaeon]
MNKELFNLQKRKDYAEIMHLFKYFYKDAWAPESIFAGKSRSWVKAFNNLIEKGFIEKQQKYPGTTYRWKAVWPDNF